MAHDQDMNTRDASEALDRIAEVVRRARTSGEAGAEAAALAAIADIVSEDRGTQQEPTPDGSNALAQADLRSDVPEGP